MKKLISPLFIVLSLIAVPTAFGHAQALGVKTKGALQAKAVVSTPVIDDTLIPLATRRDTVVLQLRDINARLAVFGTRTQVALDRLADKGIATGKAQSELTLSTNGLAAAKLSLDALSAIVIPDTDQDKTSVDIKASVIAIQTQLKDARTHLITALTSVKASLALSAESDSSL
jgi:hypothetical protein